LSGREKILKKVYEIKKELTMEMGALALQLDERKRNEENITDGEGTAILEKIKQLNKLFKMIDDFAQEVKLTPWITETAEVESEMP